MGHPSHKVMSIFIKSLGASVRNYKLDPCDACFHAKQTRCVLPINEKKATELFDLIHCDICGSYRVQSLSGVSYFLTIVDDASKAVWAYLMKEKNETGNLLKSFVAIAKRQFGKEVTIIRSDNGLKFKSAPMLKFYLDNGILHQTTCVDTP